MIHGYEDLFVGCAAIALGGFLIGCAAKNSEWFYAMRTARWLQRVLGRGGARIVHTLLGIGLIILGVAIAQGYRWPPSDGWDLLSQPGWEAPELPDTVRMADTRGKRYVV